SIKAIHPGKGLWLEGHLEWEGAQVAVGRDPLGRNAGLSRLDGNPLKLVCSREKTLDLLRPLLRLQRTGAVYEEPARFHEPSSVVEQSRLQGNEPFEIAFALEVQDIWVAPDRAGGQARRIQQYVVEACAWLPFRRIGFDNLCLELEAGHVGVQPLDSLRIDFYCRDMGTGGCKFGRLATRCRAEISHPFPGDIPKKLRWKSCSSILHPPCAILEARQVLDPPLRHEADRAGGQQHTAQSAAPAFSVRLHCDVERRFPQRCFRDLTGGIIAVSN